MNIFVDANILISVLNKEYPLFTYSSRILSLAGRKGFNVYTSPLCLGITYYFAEKKNKRTARTKINMLIDHLHITTINSNIVNQVQENLSIHDFEDGMEYYSAMHSHCNYIITQDLDDFYFAEIPVMDAESFIVNHF